jgi:alpha-1,3-fucosyltransferase
MKYSLKYLFFYGVLILVTISFIYGTFFVKPKENIRTACNPYQKNSNEFNLTIDNEIYPKFTPLYNNPKINYSCLNTDKSSKIILLWTKWFGSKTFDYGLGYGTPFKKNKCPVTNCEITNDRSRLKESNLVVFHMGEIEGRLPSYRSKYQRWIFLMYESEVMFNPKLDDYNNLFSLSATYRLDSNFTSLYYTNYIWTKNNIFDQNKDFSKDKTDFAAIVVSNCFSKSGRFDYINQLQKFIPVTVYGECGKPCPILDDNGKRGDCKEIISKKYKFYFAFENSLCKDYVTEKFFQILPYDIIPVVYGYGYYSTYVPKSGFINALDYPSAKHLAEYLMFLDKNKTAYNSYFKWKENIKFINDGLIFGHICEFCIRLNLDIHEGVENHIITDMEKFWSGEDHCKLVYAK